MKEDEDRAQWNVNSKRPTFGYSLEQPSSQSSNISESKHTIGFLLDQSTRSNDGGQPLESKMDEATLPTAMNLSRSIRDSTLSKLQGITLASKQISDDEGTEEEGSPINLVSPMRDEDDLIPFRSQTRIFDGGDRKFTLPPLDTNVGRFSPPKNSLDWQDSRAKKARRDSFGPMDLSQYSYNLSSSPQPRIPSPERDSHQTFTASHSTMTTTTTTITLPKIPVPVQARPNPPKYASFPSSSSSISSASFYPALSPHMTTNATSTNKLVTSQSQSLDEHRPIVTAGSLMSQILPQPGFLPQFPYPMPPIPPNMYQPPPNPPRSQDELVNWWLTTLRAQTYCFILNDARTENDKRFRCVFSNTCEKRIKGKGNLRRHVEWHLRRIEEEWKNNHNHSMVSAIAHSAGLALSQHYGQPQIQQPMYSMPQTYASHPGFHQQMTPHAISMQPNPYPGPSTQQTDRGIPPSNVRYSEQRNSNDNDREYPEFKPPLNQDK